MTLQVKPALAGKKGDGTKKNTTSFVGPFGNLGKQTLASSVKTRTILKNNFNNPRINNPKFVPVNKTEAKGQIWRTVNHDTEVGEFINEDLHRESQEIELEGRLSKT